jgi:hypothetical protein
MTNFSPARLLPALLGAALALPARAQTGLTNTGVLHVAAGTTLYVAGDVTNAASAALSGPGTLHLAGSLTNAGTLAPAGTLRFGGAAAQTLVPGSGAAVGTLEVASTAPAGAPALTISQDLTVNTALSLTSGLVRTAPTATLNLPVGATLTGEAPGRYVQGNLRVRRTTSASGLPIDFGLGATLNTNGQPLGTVAITRTAGLQTAGLSAGQNLAGSAHGIDRVWRIEADQAPAAPVALTLSWLADDDFGLSDFSQARLYWGASAASPWVGASAATNAASRSLSATPAALGMFTVSNAAAPLPVELTTFTAQAEGHGARLHWATASEKNNAYFDIERSLDGREFTKIGQAQGQGSKATATRYTFLDEQLPAGTSYYRLRQVDVDGTASYSPVRTVTTTAPRAAASLLVLPTVAEAGQPQRYAYTGPALPADAVLEVYDATGRCLHRQAPTGAAGLLAPAGLAPGWYWLRLRGAAGAPARFYHP